MNKNDSSYRSSLANIYDSAKIGKNVKIGAFVEVGKNVIIGDHVSLSCGVFIPENVVIESHVFIGPHTVFTNDKNPPSKGVWKKEKPTVVRIGASIGANCTILPSLTIGENARVGAGSVVTKDVKAGTLVYGNPAKTREIK